MKVTSAYAQKLLRKFNDQLDQILTEERNSQSYTVSSDESEEFKQVKPNYNFAETQKNIQDLMEKIRAVKHAINIFNSETLLDTNLLTIDEALVALPQLNSLAEKYKRMINQPAMRKIGASFNGNTTYEYCNYDIAEVKKEYAKIQDKISAIQTELDVINNTETFEIDIEV